MLLNFHIIFLLIYVTNKSFIYASELKDHKINSIFNNKNLNLRKINSENINNKIILNRTNENLYYFNIEIGTPSQIFSVLLDTGSNFFWINDNRCIDCKSKRKFNSDESKTYNNTNKLININYISGDLIGTIVSDNIKFLNNKNISDFNFILINDSKVDFELDGIFGLSKNIKDITNNEFSPLNQMYKSNIFNNNIYIIDFPNYNLYIGEKPLYLDLYTNITCKRKSITDLNNYYWKCISNNIKLKNSFNEKEKEEYIPKENNIIFNSGINSIVFASNYIPLFKNIISNNMLLNDAKCDIKKLEENNQIYSIICENFINFINNNKYSKIYKEEFISIYLDQSQKSISFNLEELYDKDIRSFKIYFINIPDNTIVLGIPLFQKYIIMLNKDDEEIVIFNQKKEMKCGESNNIKVISIISMVIMMVLIILIIFYIYYQKNRISLYKLIYQK